MTARLDVLRAELPGHELDAIVVTNATNIRWLTGFQSSNAALVVTPAAAHLLTDGRYVEAARAVEGVELIEAERDLLGFLGGRLGELARGRVGFEADTVTVAQHEKLAGAQEVELVPVERVVQRLRAVKDDDELERIRRAAAVLQQAFGRFVAEPVTGRSERELAWRMERAIRELGAEAVSFEPIVASGPNAALPHHHPGERVVRAGELLLVDAGARVDGYCSDCTRTFAVGEPPPALRRAYDVCLDAQRRSLETVRAGAGGAEVDGVARAVLLEHGYEVSHGLGHAVGLEIHEEPRLSHTSTDVLAAGNVVTVEPGVYLAGLGGVRIEDMVVVGAEGAEVLTPFTKEWTVVD